MASLIVNKTVVILKTLFLRVSISIAVYSIILYVVDYCELLKGVSDWLLVTLYC